MPREKGKPDALVLLSGGIDSTTVLAKVCGEWKRAVTVTFDYGQTLSRELKVAADNSARYGALKHYEIHLDLWPVSPGCALLRDGALPVGRTLAEIFGGGTPPSYVPFRNGIFFAYLVAMGESLGTEQIYAGCNGLLSGQYYDDTQEFAAAFSHAATVGTGPDYRPSIAVPYAATDKADIVREGLRMGVDYRHTYSCYMNTIRHCGKCDSCVQRRAAFEPHGLDLEGNHVGAAAVQG